MHTAVVILTAGAYLLDARMAAFGVTQELYFITPWLLVLVGIMDVISGMAMWITRNRAHSAPGRVSVVA